eukprot:TRINITY_DN5373_c0_g1_i1.p1 TRINITY_DN5373_c0_g1~~TRINITY_DN5373_c0_g1_i1.p1  ORF type:complete len:813 (+),score=149.41 TRINITY_DN5373_c0_g1_i1:46-2484(+)
MWLLIWIILVPCFTLSGSAGYDLSVRSQFVGKLPSSASFAVSSLSDSQALYLAERDTVLMYNVTDSPAAAGAYDLTTGTVHGVWAGDGTVLVSAGDRLIILDENLNFLGAYNTTNSCGRAYANNGYAYLYQVPPAAKSVVEVVDITDPSSPAHATTIFLPLSAMMVFTNKTSHSYVLCPSYGVRIYSTAPYPYEMGSFQEDHAVTGSMSKIFAPPGPPTNRVYVYVACEYGLAVLDCTIPGKITLSTVISLRATPVLDVHFLIDSSVLVVTTVSTIECFDMTVTIDPLQVADADSPAPLSQQDQVQADPSAPSKLFFSNSSFIAVYDVQVSQVLTPVPKTAMPKTLVPVPPTSLPGTIGPTMSPTAVPTSLPGTTGPTTSPTAVPPTSLPSTTGPTMSPTAVPAVNTVPPIGPTLLPTSPPFYTAPPIFTATPPTKAPLIIVDTKVPTFNTRVPPMLVDTPYPGAVNPTVPPSTPAPVQDSQSPSLLLYSIAPSAVIIICILVVFLIWQKKRSRRRDGDAGQELLAMEALGSVKLTTSSETSFGSVSSAFSYFALRPECLLGRGSYSCVYKATTEQGTAVAVKVIPLGDADDPLEEVAILRRVQHRHLVKFHDAEVKDKVLYITMEYLPNGTLAALVAREKMLSRRVARRYTRELISAVVYLHSIKIMHRDIKGENILLSEEGEVRLSDLGCSKVVAEVTKTVQPGAKTVVGTPRWMAPEVIMCTEVGYTNKADVWSVGCTVCEMLTGAPPWPCLATVWSTMYHIAHNDPDIPGYLDEATAGFLRMLLQKDPEGRPTAAEVEAHPWVVDENS